MRVVSFKSWQHADDALHVIRHESQSVVSVIA